MVADGEGEEKGLLLAVFRQEADAVSDSITGRGDGDGLSLDLNIARIEGIGAEDGTRRLGAAGPDKPGDTENLTLVDLQRDVMELDGASIGARVAARDVLCLERHVRCREALRSGGQEADFAADHEANDAFHVGILDSAAADMTAVAQHGVAVANLEYLLETVRDENCRDAFALQGAR